MIDLKLWSSWVIIMLLSSLVSAEVICGNNVVYGNDIVGLLCNPTTTTTTTTGTGTTVTTLGGGGGGGGGGAATTTSTTLPRTIRQTTIIDLFIEFIKNTFGAEAYDAFVDFLFRPVFVPVEGTEPVSGPDEFVPLNWMWFVPLVSLIIWFVWRETRGRKSRKKAQS